MSFDGRESGPDNPVGPLSDFGKRRDFDAINDAAG
jgi:hypothetical protein